MSYISAFFLIPSTVILLFNLLIIVYEGFSKPSFYFENSILDAGFLLMFFLSHLAGWLSIVFSVPFRDKESVTLLGKGVVVGMTTLPFAFTYSFLDGQIASAVMLLCGWIGLSLQLLPDLHHPWQRRVPVMGLIGVALILPALVNPLTWTGSRSEPVSEAVWGIYYPDYELEQGREFVEQYQRHEQRFNKQPKLIISKTGIFTINTLGRPLSNTFSHCGPEGRINIFSSDPERDCGTSNGDKSWSLLKVKFDEPGRLRCTNCRNFGKPEHWIRIDQLPEDYRLPFTSP
jgi:hypothetical protein